MIELGELEKHYEQFEAKNVRLIVVSNDDEIASATTQDKFPHLIVVSDAQQNMAKAFKVIHPGAGQHGDDTNAPTTFLVDSQGKVLWFFRPTHIVQRLSPEKLLEAIEEKL